MIIPMFFTSARILVTPFLFQAIALQLWNQAALLFFLGAITDFFDGFFARYLKQTSLLGTILDPIADKVFLMGALSALGMHISYIPLWMLWVMIGKEIVLMVGAGILLYSMPAFRIIPTWHAKLLTAIECGIILMMLLHHAQFIVVWESVLYWGIFGCMFASLYVLVEYVFKIYFLVRDNNAF